MWILRYGSILNKPRSFLIKNIPILKELFKCSLCLGFWCGAIIGFVCFKINNQQYYILFPLASSALCWFFDSLLDLIQLSCNFLDKSD